MYIHIFSLLIISSEFTQGSTDPYNGLLLNCIMQPEFSYLYLEFRRVGFYYTTLILCSILQNDDEPSDQGDGYLDCSNKKL